MRGVQVTLLSFLIYTTIHAEYWEEHENFIKQEEDQMIGSSITLNQREKIANNILMAHKWKEYDAGLENPDKFLPARHFFDVYKDVEKSEVFKIIKKLPKGASLHGHSTAIVSFEFLYNLTYTDDLYACNVSDKLKLKFLAYPGQDTTCDYTLVSDLRKEDLHFDDWLKSKLTLYDENHSKKYKNINEVWEAFDNIFEAIDEMLLDREVYEEYLYQVMKELYEDNVMYLEFKGSLDPLNDLNEIEYAPMEVVSIIIETIDRFKKDYPDFLGARYIYGNARNISNETANEYVKIIKEFKDLYPDFLAGFDLVGMEDVGRPLSDFQTQIKELSCHGVDFYFHAGETNWYGTSTDYNLIDAIIFGAKRIGHGFALTKHPLVMEMVKERNIAVEICPISNQVLMYVDDLRNHPLTTLIAQGFPVVICNDDPTFWFAKGLSYDFYMAFMGMASRNADLRLLKQLAKNSIMYSAMPMEEKISALESWEKQWNLFIEKIISEHDHKL